MTGVAFLFPGQGSQYVGMGKDILSSFPIVKDMFDEAGEALGFDLAGLCTGGPKEDLDRTANTQPAVLALDVAIYTILASRGTAPGVVAGHSLGEYAALVACGSLEFLDAVRLVRKRGEIMERVAGTEGTMAALIGFTKEEVTSLCCDAGGPGIVEPANINGGGQIVVSGTRDGVSKAVRLAKERGGRGVPLTVSGAFHSSLARDVAAIFARELEGVKISRPRFPIVANVTGDYVGSIVEIKDNLVKHLTSPVLWENSIMKMWSSGATVFIEAGPGKVQSRLAAKICPDARVFSAEDRGSVEKALEFLGEVL